MDRTAISSALRQAPGVAEWRPRAAKPGGTRSGTCHRPPPASPAAFSPPLPSIILTRVRPLSAGAGKPGRRRGLGGGAGGSRGPRRGGRAWIPGAEAEPPPPRRRWFVLFLRGAESGTFLSQPLEGGNKIVVEVLRC